MLQTTYGSRSSYRSFFWSGKISFFAKSEAPCGSPASVGDAQHIRNVMPGAFGKFW
jgi:hypothetical protein